MTDNTEKKRTKVLLNTSKDFRKILDQIKELLIKKAVFENRPQTKDNKTNICGVAFWFAANENGNYFLIYTSPPEEWDLDMMEFHINELERKYMNLITF